MARNDLVAEQFRIAQVGTLQQIQKAIVDTAKREHARVMSTPPRPLTYQRLVDGALGAPEEAVKSNGVIVYQYPRLDLVVQAALLALIDKSPILSGDYIRAHTVFLNDKAVLNGQPGGISGAGNWFQSWKPGDEVIIANFIEYSRIIELGHRKGGKPIKMRVPGTDHVYEQAQQIVQRRYGNIATIRFTWIGVIPGGNGGIIRGRAGNQSDNRWPALVIREK